MDQIEQQPAVAGKLRTLAMVVYALQALGFLIGISWIVAVLVNYVKKEEVRGTWLESHFRWQIRTFWFGLLWAAVGLMLHLIFVGWLVWAAAAIWLIYRIVKGWLFLYDNKPMPA